MIRRFIFFGANTSTLIAHYHLQRRSILKYACPVWSPGLLSGDIIDLERVQKSAFVIIFGRYSYDEILKRHGLHTLEERRLTLCEKFAIKAAKNPLHAKWFQLKNRTINTRSKESYQEVRCRTERWKNSPIPIMTRMLNSKTSK